MPHSIDFDGLEKNLFILQHLCFASKGFCMRNNIGREVESVVDYEWWEYSGLLKSIVSNTVIESAMKVSMLQDLAKSSSEDIDLSVVDQEACENLPIEKVSEGNIALSLRESCNKVVHATEARMSWSKSSMSSDSPEYWDGTYVLWGENRGSKWQVELIIELWCAAMIRFTKIIQQKVDWYHIFKHDK